MAKKIVSKQAAAKRVKPVSGKKSTTKPVVKKLSAEKKTPVPKKKTARAPEKVKTVKKNSPAKKVVAAKKTNVPQKTAAPKSNRPTKKPVEKKVLKAKKAVAKKLTTVKTAKKTVEKFQLPPNTAKPIRGPVAISVDKPKPFSKEPAKKLSVAELKDLRARLVAVRARLVGLVKGLRNESLVRHDEVNHEEDGTDAFIRLSGLDRATTEQRRVVMIDEALRAIDEGSYGLCEHCGNRIEYQRLQALPFARMCIRCQSESESAPNGRIPVRQKLWK